jgi:hypothetical protein
MAKHRVQNLKIDADPRPVAGSTAICSEPDNRLATRHCVANLAGNATVHVCAIEHSEHGVSFIDQTRIAGAYLGSDFDWSTPASKLSVCLTGLGGLAVIEGPRVKWFETGAGQSIKQRLVVQATSVRESERAGDIDSPAHDDAS